MKNTIGFFATLSCAALLVGCASLNYHSHVQTGMEDPRIYPGLREDCVGIATAHSELFGPLVFGYCLVDTPFSFGVDTLYLPEDIIETARYKQPDQTATNATKNMVH